MNQSDEATVWPFSRVRFSAGSVPRMLTFSPWPNWRSTVTPGTMVRASATLLLGNLPTSSAVTTSIMALALRLDSIDCCSEARMPVTTTASTASGFASCAKAGAAMATASTLADAVRMVLWKFLILGFSPFSRPSGLEPNPKPNPIPILLRTSAERGTSQASDGNCDGNLSDDKAKKEPIADHVLIG